MTNKQKLIASFGLVAVMAWAFLAHGAASHQSQTFIHGQQLIVSNNTTVTNGEIGVFYISRGGQNLQSGFTNTVLVTNGTTVVTNTININDGWAEDCNMVADNNGQSESNVCVTLMANWTNIFLPPQQNAFPLGANPTNVITLPNVNATNTLTLTFVRQCDTSFGNISQSYGNNTTNDSFTWNVVVLSNGITMSTNLPAAFCAGARRIRLLTVAANNTGSSPGVIVNSVTLSGFTVINPN